MLQIGNECRIYVVKRRKLKNVWNFHDFSILLFILHKT